MGNKKCRKVWVGPSSPHAAGSWSLPGFFTIEWLGLSILFLLPQDGCYCQSNISGLPPDLPVLFCSVVPTQSTPGRMGVRHYESLSVLPSNTTQMTPRQGLEPEMLDWSHDQLTIRPLTRSPEPPVPLYSVTKPF